MQVFGCEECCLKQLRHLAAGWDTDMASLYFPEHRKTLENSRRLVSSKLSLAGFSQTWHGMKASLSGGCWTGFTALIGSGWLVWDRLNWNDCQRDQNFIILSCIISSCFDLYQHVKDRLRCRAPQDN